MTKNLTSAASIPELPVSESPETGPPLTDSNRLKLILRERLKKKHRHQGRILSALLAINARRLS
ncbi:hypothetical protein [Microcoleus sp. N9_A1]|uniref:hypothetical protein n=1 Tax=Microcoleus sp. N9_A1 TaxID=3055380 RepID=UPI002FD3D067